MKAVLFLAFVAAACADVEHGSKSSFEVPDGFYEDLQTALLETESQTQEGGDFEFKCETTCQLVKKSGMMAGGSGPAMGGNRNMNFAGGMGPSIPSFAGMPGMPMPAAQPAAPQGGGGGNVKECYRLCLNPKMNPGCSVAVSGTATGTSGSTSISMLEEKAEPQADASNWALDKDSNCLANCVRVCVNVHNMVQLQLKSGAYKY